MRALLIVYLLVGFAPITTYELLAHEASAPARLLELLQDYQTSTDLSRKKLLIQSIGMLEDDEVGRCLVSEQFISSRRELPVATWARALLSHAKQVGNIDALQREVIDALADADADAKCDLIECLSFTSELEPVAIELLTQLAFEKDGPVSAYALAALLKKRAGSHAIAERMLKLLKSDNAIVSTRAAILCGQFGVRHDDIHRELTALLSSKEEMLRFSAAYALVMSYHQSEKSERILRESLSQKESLIAVRFQYPSNPGVSHKLLAIRALRKLR